MHLYFLGQKVVVDKLECSKLYSWGRCEGAVQAVAVMGAGVQRVERLLFKNEEPVQYLSEKLMLDGSVKWGENAFSI